MEEQNVTATETEGYEEWNPDNASEVGGEDWNLDPGMDHAWEAAEEASFKDVKPGVYDVIVTGVERKTSESSGNHFLKWTMKITTPGDVQGQNLWKNHVFVPQSLPYIKADFSLCKIVLSPPLTESIIKNIPNLVGIMLKVVVKTQKDGDGVNVYFKEFVGRETKE
jgi:hypothetical protein